MAKVIFDHLPKCGGTSVRRFLSACVGEQRIAPALAHASVGRALRLFERFDVIAGHFNGQVLVHAHPDIRYMTLLRHPVDRIVSAYHFLQMPYFEGSENPSAKAARSMSLREFVSRDDGAGVDANNNMTMHFAAARGAHVSSEDMLAAAMANLMRYDVVGVLDHLDDFFDRMARRFDWRKPAGSFHERVTPDRPELDDVDPEVRQIIETRNALDVALYDAVYKHLIGRERLPQAAPGDVGDRDSHHADSCSVRLLELNGKREAWTNVKSGATASIRAEIGIPATLKGELFAGIVVRDSAGEAVYRTGSRLDVRRLPYTFLTAELALDLVMRLGEGRYTVDLWVQAGHHSSMSVGVVRREWLQIEVAGFSNRWFAGISDLDAQWAVRPPSDGAGDNRSEA